jgi:4-amino-4-deoxy-L-arabinose transferase-like glycosyltransferase
MFAAALVIYSQTWAFTSDEGFHLLAAQLIGSGMRPYVDFFFPQTPLNAYWNAGWMAVFGQSWRVAHLVAALATAGSAFLAADYCFRRFPVPEWRLPGALAAGLLTGLNGAVAAYGPLAQAYGICLFLSVAAFRAGVAAVERRGAWAAAGSGLLASASAACSLLTAPVAPVLLVWTVVANRQGSRWKKALAFAAAASLPWVPVLRLAELAPRVVWFNLVQYHTQFRTLYWPETTEHDVEMLSSWIDSGQALTLVVLAVSGLLFLKYRSGWEQQLRREFYLCGGLALALGAELSTAHPTFTRYYVLTVPFAAILAVAGLDAMGSRVFEPARPWWPVAIAILIAVLGCAKTMFDRRDLYIWADYEKLAGKIARLTPPGGGIYADDHVYFLLHRKPPAGFEFAYSHKLTLPPAQEAALHILPQSEVDRQLSSGMYSTVYLCEDEESYKKLGLPKLYPHEEDVDECALFWK